MCVHLEIFAYERNNRSSCVYPPFVQCVSFKREIVLDWRELWQAEVVAKFYFHVMEIFVSFIVFWYVIFIDEHGPANYIVVIWNGVFAYLKKQIGMQCVVVC